MASKNSSPVQSRPMPLLGFLCLMAGCGMLYSARKFGVRFGQWRTLISAGGGVVGLILLLWGIRLIAIRFAPRVGKKVNRLNRNRVMLPREGMMYLLIMIVAFVGSLIGRSNMLMLVFSIMAGPFILNGWITFTLLKRNRISRQLPRRAMAGDVVSVEVMLKNRKFWFSSWLMVVRDRLGRIVCGKSDKADVLEPAVLFASVQPRQERTACYQLRLTSRGKYQFGPMEASTRFPLGLVERGYMADVKDELLVHPRIGRLTPHWYRDAHMATESVQHQQTRQGMFDDEFHHLRDYRIGDNPRDIHWRTSARIQDLMVRQFEQSRDRGLVVLLELWQPKSPTAEHEDRVELAISFAATVCVDHLRQTRGVHQFVFVCGQDVNSWKAESGFAATESLLDLLAIVEAGDCQGFEGCVADARNFATALTRAVLITTRPDGELPEVDLETIPWLEIIHADEETLGRWYVQENPNDSFVGTGGELPNDDAQLLKNDETDSDQANTANKLSASREEDLLPASLNGEDTNTLNSTLTNEGVSK